MTPPHPSASSPQPSQRPGGWLAGNWVPFGLWAGVALGIGRGAALYMLESAHAGNELQARMRLASFLSEALLEACAIALGLAAIISLLRRLPQRGLRLVALGTVWLAGSWLMMAFMAGWLDPDVSRTIGTSTGRGREAARILGAGGAALTLLLIVLIARSRAGAPSALALATPVLLGVLIPVSWNHAFGHQDKLMTLREIVGSVLDAPLEVLREHPKEAPHVGVLCPNSNYKVDGADLRSLILPPPAEVRIDTTDLDLPARLFGRVGLDRTAVTRHAKELPGHVVRFELFVNEASAFRIDVPMVSLEDTPGSEWRDFSGERGLALPADAQLRFTTTLLDADGTEVEFRRPMLAGFGSLRLERRSEVPRTRSSPEQPNVVLVVMDTLRADRLSTFGYERPTSPQLQKLAERGLVFEEALSTSSWTWPSTASILTGLQPAMHGVQNGFACTLADELETIAEVAQRQGFTTAAWSGNPLIVPDKNFDQGFEVFVHSKGALRKSDTFVPSALEWIESTGDTRFFLYLHLVEPHAPAYPSPTGRARFASGVPAEFSRRAINDYDAPLRDGEGHAADGTPITDEIVPVQHQRWISDVYDAQVWTGDEWLGRVLQQLEDSGLDDRTIVVFTSDHGEELFDHDLLTHGRTLFREVVHVPLVLAGPGIPRGTRIKTPVSNRHIAPTLARLMGASMPEVTDALDLAELEADPAIEERPLVFTTTQGWWNGEHPQTLLGLRRGSWVLHYAPQAAPWGAEFPGSGELRLFDVVADPEESIDLASEWDAVANGMRVQLEARLADLEERAPSAPVQAAGEATLETLRALGYIDDDED